MRKIILKQHQSPGDVLCFTRAVAEIKETFPDWLVDVRTPCPEIFENNPCLTPLDERDKEVEIISLENAWVHQSGWSGIHYTEGFVKEAEEKLGVQLKRTGMHPLIWMSDEEKSWTSQVAGDYDGKGLNYKGSYWIINAGYKPDCYLKYYPYYQEVVDLLKDKVQFVQVGHPDHIHPELKGVFNLIGKTTLREMIRLFYWSKGSLGPISAQMHMSAAFRQPAVVIAGGKEPMRWEAYPNHRYLSLNGCLKCAPWDGCWLSKSEDCLNKVGGFPRCYALIRPEDVARAVELYYLGGYLTYD